MSEYVNNELLDASPIKKQKKKHRNSLLSGKNLDS